MSLCRFQAAYCSCLSKVWDLARLATESDHFPCSCQSLVPPCFGQTICIARSIGGISLASSSRHRRSVASIRLSSDLSITRWFPPLSQDPVAKARSADSTYHLRTPFLTQYWPSLVYGCNTRNKTGKCWLSTHRLLQNHQTAQADLAQREADLLKEVEEREEREREEAVRQQQLAVKAAEDEEERQAARERRERREEERNRLCHGVDEAIRRHDVDVAALISQLSLCPPSSVAPRPDRNHRGDREKAQGEIKGKIMDVQDELQADLEY
ncbi:hypothetical protein DFH06DRAFT_1327650 [Mycena polygramma]|nr:hypothetical protein DFH06DRAFT_1327650 [Mycena polygramma]